MAAPSRRSGVLLLHGDAKSASAWVRQGIVPSYVVPLAGWTAVVPGGAAQGPAPYDDRLTVTAARPVPARMRTALGFFEIGGRAVVVVHPRGWRALPRWLVWESGRGVAGLPSLPTARPGDLAMAAGVVPEATRPIRQVLAEHSALALDVLSDLMTTLALPGEELLRGGVVKSADDAALIEPDGKSVDRFARVTKEDKEIRAELESM
ncbi:hypothetical protein HJ588_15270 [Flexivirga sp. ID2601S]|uniref:Uncharacterized protein n=1 Tax=Flexivirga aerilata TaxID=1656889 RepID=A0A849AJN1_9MICO|nr:hypothetical protein [Flexivirga aerilata]NNG40625.1 hypothetical protein [Flexivirga aerilata]